MQSLTFITLVSMKLDKSVVQRRVDLMAAEGVVSEGRTRHLIRLADKFLADIRS
jgi:hypothetical protein